MKKSVLLAFVSVLLFSMSVVMHFEVSVKAEPRTWTVDDDGPADFSKIKDAISAASSGDTIFVYNGTYYEWEITPKNNLSLIGENKDNTIIDGRGFGWIIKLVGTRSVTISGFTIKNSSVGTAGIWLNFATKNKILRNNIIKNHDGVYALSSYENLIEGNLVANNYEGIILSTDCRENKIRGNNIINNTFLDGFAGVDLTNGARDNEVEKNNITQNKYGISISHENNSISGNQIIENDVGIYEWSEPTYGYRIFHNNFINNTQQVTMSNSSSNTWDDGYPSGGNYWSDYEDRYLGAQEIDGSGIWNTSYVINSDNRDRYPLMNPWSPLPVHNINTGSGYATIQGAINANKTLNGHVIFVDAGTYLENVVVNKAISLIGADKFNTIIDGNYAGNVMNITFSNVTITSFTIQKSGAVYANCGIYLGKETTGNNLSCNIIKNNYFGIRFDHSSNNTISGNNVKNNGDGINLFDSSDNSISGNYILNNGNGIWAEFSSNNTLAGNNVANNWYGIDLNYSSGNGIYHNNFINNNLQAKNRDSNNTWDDGYPSGGNYWDDYGKVDADGDGIGETPYEIDANNTDRYPLVVPLGPIPIVWDETIYPVELQSNSTISRFQFNASQKIISFNVTGPDGTLGFCNLISPNSLVQDLWQNNFKVLVDGEEPIMMNNWTDGTRTYIYFTYLHSEHKVTIVSEFPTWASMLLILLLLTVAIAIYKRKLLKTLTH